MLNKLFIWIDEHRNEGKGKLLYQFIPIFICAILYLFFITSSHFYISHWINSQLTEKISLHFHWLDVIVGIFLYFVTAIDYAIVVGRMSIKNSGSKARVIMNVATVMGCYVGVTGVLFLWGFAKEITLLIIPILIFAGSVMIKLAHEGTDYFMNSPHIPNFLKKITITSVKIPNYLTRIFTFWMPEIARPSTQSLTPLQLAKWSFLLPFIIGLDDLIGYMGAMTIYNVFGLLIGIYLADVLIDVMIFVSPSLTKKLVKSATLSFMATYAFLYLAYKSYKEVYHLIQHEFATTNSQLLSYLIAFIVGVIILDIIMAKIQHRQSFLSETIRGQIS